VIAAALVLLALVDGALLGFRAGAGRVGLVKKGPHLRRSMALGIGAAAIVAAGGLALALALTALLGAGTWGRLVLGGSAAVEVFGVFGGLMLGALAIWSVPIAELRTFVTVSLLGPGTLLRPAVIVGGMLAAFVRAPSWEIAALALYGASAMLLVEPWLTRRYFPIDERLVPPLGEAREAERPSPEELP